MKFVGTHIGPNVASAPTGAAGQIYYNTTANRLYAHDGTAWQDLTLAAKGGPIQGLVGAVGTPTYTFQGATTTGMYSPATNQIGFAISGTNKLQIGPTQVTVFTNLTSTQVISTTNTITSGTGSAASPSFSLGDANGTTGLYSPGTDQFGISTGGVSRLTIGTTGLVTVTNRIAGVTDPTGAQDAATKNYVDTTPVSTSVWKQPVRAATTTTLAIVVASPGATIDGVALTAGDRVLLTGQVTASENGIWIWNGAGVPMTRPTDWNSTTTAQVGSRFVVTQGATFQNTVQTANGTAYTNMGFDDDVVISNPGGSPGSVRWNTGAQQITGYNTGLLTLFATTAKIDLGSLAFGYNTTGFGVGRATPAAAIDLVSSTTAAGGIAFGNNEFRLYRSAANTLVFDGLSFQVSATNGGISVGSAFTPTNNNDVATKGYVDNVAQGLDAKQSVRVATDGTETYTIAGGAVTQITGTTVDGVTLAVNDRILIKNAPATSGVGGGGPNGVSSSAPNGIYTVTNATTNLTVTRANDADTATELISAYVWVENGGGTADTGWVCTNDPGFTLNTQPVIWAKFASNHVGQQLVAKYVGNVAAANPATVNHGLGTQFVSVQVQEAGAPYNVVYTDVQVTDANNVTLTFATTPTGGQYTVTVIG